MLPSIPHFQNTQRHICKLRPLLCVGLVCLLIIGYLRNISFGGLHLRRTVSIQSRAGGELFNAFCPRICVINIQHSISNKHLQEAGAVQSEINKATCLHTKNTAVYVCVCVCVCVHDSSLCVSSPCVTKQRSRVTYNPYRCISTDDKNLSKHQR